MRLIRLISFLLTVTMAFSAGGELQLLKRTADRDIYNLSFQNIEAEAVFSENDVAYSRITFDNAGYPAVSKGYDFPSRTFLFALPANGSIDVKLIESSEKTITGLHPYRVDGDYEASGYALTSHIEVSDPTVFRDMRVVSVRFNPVSYNPQTQTAQVWKDAVFEVIYDNISEGAGVTLNAKEHSFSSLYPEIIANFDRARQWLRPRKTLLQKASAMSDGDYYRFEVDADGIYRINASTVADAGADLSNVPLSAVELYNNGGHTLSYATNAQLYNPATTQQVPVEVVDANSNNLFDSGDYILFFGKALNSFFYEPDQDAFRYQMHPYDTRNVYLLTLQGNNGKRVQLDEPAETTGVARTWAYDYFHFERDEYNLLASGPDWYGHRFFGLSGNFSHSFELPATISTAAAAQFRIQFKGGAGIRYGDNALYRYRFNIDLNGQNILNDNEVSILKEALQNYTRTIDNPQLLTSSSNTVNIQYSSTNEGSVAYLDWFELRYAKNLTTETGVLNFYTANENEAVNYQLGGLSGQVNIWDVTNPTLPVAYAKNIPASGATLVLDASSAPRHIVAFSNNAGGIKRVTRLNKVTTEANLLETSQQADYLIITPTSLKTYAQDIAELRSELTTKIVSPDDIYFYFNSAVKDPVAIRNFIRYAYYNWSGPAPEYILLFGDGHYDYRNIEIADSNLVPTFQIYDDHELGSRANDSFFAQLEMSDNRTHLIVPSLAIGRLPVENALDARRVVEKLRQYDENPIRDGWQTFVTIVGDDEKVSNPNRTEWIHQSQAEDLATLSVLDKFNKSRIYLSRYEEVAGGLGRLKPQATQDLINQINRGSLIINYVGHGSPTTWAHETVFNFDRDYKKINNEERYPFFIAATCDFAKFDDPNEVSFTEALIWKERSGIIGTAASTRLVYSGQNFEFNKRFYRNLFPSGGPSVSLGRAMLRSLATEGFNNINDQKYFLLADPAMYLADARENMEIVSISPDTLKALSRVDVQARVADQNDATITGFEGGAVMLVNDAEYRDVNTGGGEQLNYDLLGPLVFKGEVSVENGFMNGSFIVPKSIRYKNERSGKITIYAWDNSSGRTALSSANDLLFLGSANITPENEGPEIDIYFENQENFTSGDMVKANPVIVARLFDASGINITGQLGHQIELVIDDSERINISEFFTYDRDSYNSGKIRYPLSGFDEGRHTITLQAFDNLNNRNEARIEFAIAQEDDLLLTEVVNYPNPFSRDTEFTFQCNSEGAEIEIKIYTISGRLIEKLEGFSSRVGYNTIPWSGLDRDGNQLANGVYLYKVILKGDGQKEEKIEKMVVVR